MSRTTYRVGALAGSALLLLCAPARAADDRLVKQAVDRGVAVLKQMVGGKHGDGDRGSPSGQAALIGLTLLECGVSADDATIQKTADRLRKECPELDYNYSLALCVMFFDRLGDSRDRLLVQTMGVRLLGGQTDTGGWSYNCRTPDAAEVERLKLAATEASSPGTTEAKPDESVGKKPPPLPQSLQDEVERIEKMWQPRGPREKLLNGNTDNSNTQFAILGLWVAGRHGVPVEKALLRTETRFRTSQYPDGGWGYQADFDPARRNGSSAAMTCAGLLSLAMSHGAVNQAVLRTNPKAQRLPRDPARDAAVRAALGLLGTAIGQPVGPGQAAPAISKGFYFLWSLERVAVAYNLGTIGGKDWYTWGAQMLLAGQQKDGSWSGEYGAEADTCFALLFLRRANLARELTATLRGVKDPGVVLRAGGVGGDGLMARGLASGVVLNDGAAKSDDEAGRLCQQLLRAPADQQEPLIVKLKDGKGVAYTDALAAAIPQLTGSTRTKARDALAERLARMTANTLREKLQTEDAEVRRAAAVACYMREERGLVPDLIGRLEDKEPGVARAAHAALKELTKQDFGPATAATAEDRAKAVAAWKAWWQKQAK